MAREKAMNKWWLILVALGSVAAICFVCAACLLFAMLASPSQQTTIREPIPTNVPAVLIRATPTSSCNDETYINAAIKASEQTQSLLKRISNAPTSITPFNISEMEQTLRDFEKINPPECFVKVHSLTLDIMRDTLDSL